MKKRPNATPSGPAGHSRQAFQGGTYSLMLTAAVLALLIVLNLLVSALPTNLTQYDISASKLYSVTSNTKVVVNALEQDVTIYWIVQSGEEDAVIENLLGKYESLSDHITVVKKTRRLPHLRRAVHRRDGEKQQPGGGVRGAQPVYLLRRYLSVRAGHVHLLLQHLL